MKSGPKRSCFCFVALCIMVCGSILGRLQDEFLYLVIVKGHTLNFGVDLDIGVDPGTCSDDQDSLG